MVYPTFGQFLDLFNRVGVVWIDGSVAPSLVASCNLAGLVSTAMTRPAPAT